MFSILRPRWFAVPIVVVAAASLAQVSPKPSGADASAAARRAVEIAAKGQCAEALPSLRRTIAKLTDPNLKRKAGLSGVRCSMTLGRPEAATEFLQVLGHDFPGDPEVLYVLVHAYSDLSTRAAQELARTAPNSEQAHLLNAEALEMQDKWDAAAAEYRKVLQQNPNLPGTHFRLGRLLLSRPNPGPDVSEQARKEFEKELEIDPSNAAAEYILGELARQNQQLEEAIKHFSRAAQRDPGFGDAFLGLGEALISARKFSEAVPPLETAVKLEPGNPTAHYNLATAYGRTGRKADADKEFAIHRQMTQNEPGENPASPENPPANPN
jgi:tetratricopeptide (TPR) repeat protein